MVTIKESGQQLVLQRQQLTQAGRELSQQRQILESVRKQTEAARLPELSPAQLRARGRQQLVLRQTQEKQLGEAKRVKIEQILFSKTELKKSEKELRKLGEALRSQERLQADLAQVDRALFAKNGAFLLENQRQRKFFNLIQRNQTQQVRTQVEAEIDKLKSKGVTDIEILTRPGLDITIKGIKVEAPPKVEVIRPTIGRPTIIGLPTPPPKVPVKPPVIAKATREFFKRFGEIIPKEERGLIGLFGLDRKKEISRLVTEVTPFIPSGGGTAEFRTRQKTFFEQLNINPNDKDAKTLQKNVELTQRLFEFGRINQSVAEQQNKESFDAFTKIKLQKGIPINFALGAGFALLQAVPILGTAVSVALGTDLILKRNQIVRQFKDFPIETGAGFGAFIAGGAAVGSTLKVLTSRETLLGSKKSFIFERSPSAKLRKTPLSETFPIEVEFRINDAAIKSFAVAGLKNRGINFNQLSGIEQNFILGQIKARIINNPELFIPVARQAALKAAKIRNIRQAVQQRLEGQPDPLIEFKKLGRIKQQQKIPEIQQLALRRLAERLERERIKGRAIERPLERPFDLISDQQRNILTSRIKSQVDARPELFLSKTQKIALEKVKTKSELQKVRQAILKGLEPQKPGDVLTLQQRTFIKSQIEAQLRANPAKFLPKARQQALKQFQKAQEKRAIERAVEKGPQQLKLSDLISLEDKKILKSRLDAQVRADPAKFIPETRQRALQLLKPPELRLPSFKVTLDGRLTFVQRLALQRLKDAGKTKTKVTFSIKIPEPVLISGKKVIGKVDLKGIPRNVGGAGLTEAQILRARGKPGQFIIEESGVALSLSGQRQELQQTSQSAQSEILKLGSQVKTSLRTRDDLKTKLESLQKQRLKFPLFSQKSRQLLKQEQAVQQKLSESTKQAQASQIQLQTFSQQFKQLQKFKQSQLQRTRERIRITKPPELKIPKRPPFIPIREIVKKKIKPIRVPLSLGGFNVFVREKGLFKKMNKAILKRPKAFDLGAFLTDKSTARTLKIKQVPFKSQKPILKVPSDYFKKNRRKFRGPKRKGKIQPIKNLAIEKRKFAIDSKSEVKQLSAARIRARLFKPKKKSKSTSGFKRIKPIRFKRVQ